MQPFRKKGITFINRWMRSRSYSSLQSSMKQKVGVPVANSCSTSLVGYTHTSTVNSRCSRTTGRASRSVRSTTGNVVKQSQAQPATTGHHCWCTATGTSYTGAHTGCLGCTDCQGKSGINTVGKRVDSDLAGACSISHENPDSVGCAVRSCYALQCVMIGVSATAAQQADSCVSVVTHDVGSITWCTKQASTNVLT